MLLMLAANPKFNLIPAEDMKEAYKKANKEKNKIAATFLKNYINREGITHKAINNYKLAYNALKPPPTIRFRPTL